MGPSAGPHRRARATRTRRSRSNPTAFDFKPPKVYAWNVGVQHKLWKQPHPRRRLRRLRRRRTCCGDGRSTRCRSARSSCPRTRTRPAPASATPGATALPDDLLRPFPGYGNIQMWDYSSSGNYHALQTSLNRRFDNGRHVLGVLRLEQGPDPRAQQRLSQGGPPACQCGAPNSGEQVRRLDYSYAPYDRPHNFVVNFVYQTPKVGERRPRPLANDWQISGIYRWTSGLPYAINFSIPGITRDEPHRQQRPANARVVVTGDPGTGSSGDPYRQIDTVGLRAAAARQRRQRVGALLPARTRRSTTSTSRSRRRSRAGKRIRLEVRLDAFNALNHTQFTGVNNTVNFASLTDRRSRTCPTTRAATWSAPTASGPSTACAPPRTLQLVTRLTF